MEYERDYTSYSFDDLLEIRDHIDRERYPQKARRIDDEIALRKNKAQQLTYSAQDNADETKFSMGNTEEAFGRPFTMPDRQTTELVLEFNGSAKEYFRIWIVNLCLTLLTFGVFSAWAKVRKKRFSYTHTTLDGTPFQYLATPIPILKGRLIAGAGFLFYYISGHFITTLVPWVLGAGLILAPWVLIRSAAFNARYTAYRNMTFHFEAGYFKAFNTIYIWGIIPILLLGALIKWKSMPVILSIASLVLAIFVPMWLCRIKKFLAENNSFGSKRFTFLATGGQFFSIYFRASLITVAVSIPIGIFAAVWSGLSKNWTLITYLMPIVSYAGYVFAYAYVKARSGNLVYNNLHLGPIRFKSTLRAMDLVKLYVTNAIGIVFSLGLLIPWAIIRTWKYRADHTQVLLDGDLTEFEGSQGSKVAATGAEALDFFDVDISI